MLNWIEVWASWGPFQQRDVLAFQPSFGGTRRMAASIVLLEDLAIWVDKWDYMIV
jgi:hypothetical protein